MCCRIQRCVRSRRADCKTTHSTSRATSFWHGPGLETFAPSFHPALHNVITVKAGFQRDDAANGLNSSLPALAFCSPFHREGGFCQRGNHGRVDVIAFSAAGVGGRVKGDVIRSRVIGEKNGMALFAGDLPFQLFLLPLSAGAPGKPVGR